MDLRFGVPGCRRNLRTSRAVRSEFDVQVHPRQADATVMPTILWPVAKRSTGIRKTSAVVGLIRTLGLLLFACISTALVTTAKTVHRASAVTQESRGSADSTRALFETWSLDLGYAFFYDFSRLPLRDSEDSGLLRSTVSVCTPRGSTRCANLDLGDQLGWTS